MTDRSYQAVADRARHANLGYRDGVAGGADDIEERIATMDRCIRSYGVSLAFLSERLKIADPDGATVSLVRDAR